MYDVSCMEMDLIEFCLFINTFFSVFFLLVMAASRAVFFVSIDEVARHRSTGLKWVDIASILGVTPKTLRLWRINNNYEVSYILSFPIPNFKIFNFKFVTYAG